MTIAQPQHCHNTHPPCPLSKSFLVECQPLCQGRRIVGDSKSLAFEIHQINNLTASVYFDDAPAQGNGCFFCLGQLFGVVQKRLEATRSPKCQCSDAVQERGWRADAPCLGQEQGRQTTLGGPDTTPKMLARNSKQRTWKSVILSWHLSPRLEQ